MTDLELAQECERLYHEWTVAFEGIDEYSPSDKEYLPLCLKSSALYDEYLRLRSQWERRHPGTYSFIYLHNHARSSGLLESQEASA